MVDDIISAFKCGSTATAVNATIIAFIDYKKLKLGINKCTKNYIGNKSTRACVLNKPYIKNN